MRITALISGVESNPKPLDEVQETAVKTDTVHIIEETYEWEISGVPCVDPNDPSIAVTNGIGQKTDNFRPTTNGIGTVKFTITVTNDHTSGACAMPDLVTNVEFAVISADLDIDSDNTSDFGGPDKPRDF